MKVGYPPTFPKFKAYLWKLSRILLANLTWAVKQSLLSGLFTEGGDFSETVWAF